ncbi:MAG: hypothetical protein QM765_11255 [Myxococcales bacterium]
MAHRPLPLLLGSLLLASACLPPPTNPTCQCQAGFACVDDVCQPLACSALDETDCLTRADCQARYAEAVDRCAAPAESDEGVRCGGSSKVFVACENKGNVCSPVTCDLWCEHGMARDANGCEVCACASASCETNADCRSNEICALPDVDCGVGATCKVQGVCTVVSDPGCDSDADCKPGEACVFPTIDCPPNAFCAPPRGSCKPAGGCLTDADCGVGRRCEPLCDGPGCLSSCVDRTPCIDGSECGYGQTCGMDPNDPCRYELCYSLVPVQTYCIPTCEMLGEAECVARRDCEAMYEAPRCGNDPMPGYFIGCKPVGCPPVMCDLWCEKGFKVDERGCNTCQCDDSCTSDADCLPGQVCVMPMVDCAPGSDCAKVAVRGVCNTIQPGCQSDADCASGETCVFASTYCGGAGSDDGSNQGGGTGGCIAPASGVCVKLETSCTSDADCKAGQYCSIPEIVCPPNALCAQPAGVCVDVPPPAGCRTDADCAAGETCAFAVDACPATDPACSNTGVCVPTNRTCSADSDCAANELCALVDCGPNMDCMQQGVCTPRAACASNAECAYGESCQPDPTDPCNSGTVYCFAAGRTICLPIPTCRADSDCASGQHCLPDPTDPCNQPNVDCFAPGRMTCQ